MSDFIVLGTDTDAGKTTFSLLWLTAFPEYAYWKPLETGTPDSETVSRLVPGVRIVPSVGRFRDPVAPPLAASREGKQIPDARELADREPSDVRPLLIETFGGPLSPLNEHELQIALIRRLDRPAVLVTSSAVGAVGRTLSTLRAVRTEGIAVRTVVLFGPSDSYAEREIRRHGSVEVEAVTLPADWTIDSIRSATAIARPVLERILGRLATAEQPPVAVDRSADWVRRDRRVVWHPYTSLRDPADPLPVVGADREFLHLADGRRLIDAVSSWWTILYGHRHPPLTAALHRAADTLDHVLFAGATHPPAIETAERLLRLYGGEAGARVFFSDNGSTAVEVALKIAYQHWCDRGAPERTLFIGFENAYHGDTFGAMSVSRDRLFFSRFEPLLFQALQIPVSAERLDDTLKAHANRTAAVIIEPLVQGAGGMRMHAASELAAIGDVCRRYGIPLIADEVMTTFRTGTFWAYQQSPGLTPDLVCTAKTLAGGMLPLAATVVSAAVTAGFDTDERIRTFFHGHSFSAHPLACAVAAENLRMAEEGAWRISAERIAAFWRTQKRRFHRPGVRDVRQCGTIFAVEIESAEGYLATAGAVMRATAIQHGVLLRPLGNVIYAIPPLDTSDGSLARIADAMEAAVSAVTT